MKDDMVRFLFILMLWGVSLTLAVVIMMKGWGLEPKSWFWIIGGGIFMRGIIEVMALMGKNKK